MPESSSHRAASSSEKGCDASNRQKTSSAPRTRVSARATPIFSTSSAAPCMPAVSTRCSITRPSGRSRSSVSRVVPAIGVTMAASSPASALYSELLPRFGAPQMTVLMPSKIALPAR